MTVTATSPSHRLLFVKHTLAYPRASGHDIRCFEMLRALRALGHEVALATIEPCDPTTREQLPIPIFSLDDDGIEGGRSSLTYWQERFRSYWGVSRASVDSVKRIADEFNATAVIGLGLDVLPLLAGSGSRTRVWYAADEWITHHLSQLRPFAPRTYSVIRAAAVLGLYERAYAGALDRAWVVSPTEQRAMHRLAGVKHVDVIPNGVDTDFFSPQGTPTIECSAIFWGRLDFGPNLQAMDWFCSRIWPQVVREVPSATLTIMGFKPDASIRAHAETPGVQIRSDMPDIRPSVAEHQLALLPMVSGGGIKNKLLEAAAMGKAIICTSMACGGLRGTPPAVIVDDEAAWVKAIVRLWANPAERQQLERSARAWILEHHTWEAAARDALRGLDSASPKGATIAAPARSASLISQRSRQVQRVLFVKQSLTFPRVSGHDVHCFELLRALRQAGCHAALATIVPPSPQSIEQLGVPWYSLAGVSDDQAAVQLHGWQERFRSYWGVTHQTIRAVAAAGKEFDASAVVGVGLDAMPYLANLGARKKIWYAADEWVTHHLSLIRMTQPSSYSELRPALLKGVYQRVYARSIDRAWVVSPAERRAMRLFAGIAQVDVIPNGVDFEHFSRPNETAQVPNSAVFWGRLDFEPNIQGLQWFCDQVWPRLRRSVPTARFTIVGFNAVNEVRELGRLPGIQLQLNVPDIRPIATGAEVVVVPLVSRGGIKNKLLEAAALQSAIVCTSDACSGTRTPPPALIVDNSDQWVEAILKLWRSPAERHRLGVEARAWVMAHHTWKTAAEDALRSLEL